MDAQAAAYYHYPVLYAGEQPEEDVNRNIDVRRLGDEVYRAALTVGITVKVLREGRFIFDFSDWERGKARSADRSDFDSTASVILKRVSVLNAHLACLYTALFRQQRIYPQTMVVEPSQVISMKSLDDSGMGIGDKRVLWLASAQHIKTYSKDRPIWNDPRIAGRLVVLSIPTLAESFHLLNAILEHPNADMVLIADLLLRSSKALHDHNYSLSLITSWSIAEKVLQLRWEKYLDSQKEREDDGKKIVFINKDRKKNLMNGRDYSASVVSEILSLAGILSFELYKDMQLVRKARNNWIHNLSPVSRETAELSIKVAATLLYYFERIYLSFPISTSLHYTN